MLKAQLLILAAMLPPMLDESSRMAAEAESWMLETLVGRLVAREGVSTEERMGDA